MTKTSNFGIKRPFSLLFPLIILSFILGCSSPSEPTDAGDETLIQLQDPLDEPEYYCVDVPGFRDTLDLEGALTAHTCKPNSEDELFVFESEAGQLRMEAYGLCVEAEGAAAGASLLLRDCDPERPLQKFTFANDQIQLGNALCLAISAADGEPTGGPSHLRRDLMLQSCAEVESALSQWTMPGPEPIE